MHAHTVWTVSVANRRLWSIGFDGRHMDFKQVGRELWQPIDECIVMYTAVAVRWIAYELIYIGQQTIRRASRMLEWAERWTDREVGGRRV